MIVQHADLPPNSSMPLLFQDKETVTVRAYFLGQKIELHPFCQMQPLAVDPLTVSKGECGCIVLFDYGAAILFGLSAAEEGEFLAEIRALIKDPFDNPETEEVSIQIVPGNAGKVEGGIIQLAQFDVPILQLVADVLAKSVVLAEYEIASASVFDQIEPFAESLQEQNFNRQQGTSLLKQIGNSLMIQHKIVGRVEIIDKPELLWEYPELDRIYARLEDEYEIRERHIALERKLDLVSRTAETALEIQHQNTGIRLEWYVVILIVIEVLISIYELATGA